MHKTQGYPHPEGTIRGLAQAPLHLQNMVAELVDNALGASSDQQNVEVCVDLSGHREGGDLYTLSVWDNGPGISLVDLQKKVFVLGCPP